MVIQKFKAHYNDAGFSINVVVDLHRKESLEFSTWTEFENYKFFDSEYVESVIIKWEYNAKLPQYRVPQKHTLVVKLTNGLKPEEILNLVFVGNLENMRALEAEGKYMRRILEILVKIISTISELIENYCVGKDDVNSYRYKNTYKFKKY